MAHGSTHFDVLAPRSKLYKGPFGRLCPNLPAWNHGKSDDALDACLKGIAENLMVERPGLTPKKIAADKNLVRELEAEFDSNIPAGYTYFGQFVDHDITFDPASSLMRQNDPNGLVNFRTPRLDLDNVYGAGPDDQPYLYNKEDKALMAVDLIGDNAHHPDLPRYCGTALIGDMRNDENSMVSQLQLAFLLAHNALVERAREQFNGIETKDAFEMARRTLRWLYQHIVWNDFMPRITINEVRDSALFLEPTKDGRQIWKLGLKDIYNWKHHPFMPVEFSVAAYRFGHSMVRNSYQTNAAVRGFEKFAPIFQMGKAKDTDDLRGFRTMQTKNMIQWDWFLDMGNGHPTFPQMARKIDTKLANALAALPDENDPLNILAFRNLKRSVTFDLPSGTDVARKWCINNKFTLDENEPDALWYYILREAQSVGGNGLGRVGSLIVCATFAGLLKGDPCSWINMDPCWNPSKEPLLRDGEDNQDDPNWALSSIIRIAGIDPAGIGTIEPIKMPGCD